MPFAIKPKTPHIHKRDRRISVITGSECLQEIPQFLQENGIVIGWLPSFRRLRLMTAFRAGIRKPQPLASRLAHPVRRGIDGLVAADYAKRQLFTGLDPVLRHGVENIPMELSFLWLKIAPQHSQINNGCTRKRVGVARLRVHAVRPKTVGVMVMHQTHAGIYERFARILRAHRNQTVGIIASAAQRKSRCGHRQQALQWDISFLTTHDNYLPLCRMSHIVSFFIFNHKKQYSFAKSQ